jgi:hypothetical protein
MSSIPAFFIGIISRLFAISPEQGAETIIYLASSPEVEGVTVNISSRKKPRAPRRNPTMKRG